MKAELHKKSEPCPDWCHFCPHMHGGVFPHCFGSVVNGEDDLSGCTCDPGDPLTTHLSLVSMTQVLIRCLRDARRHRRLRPLSVQRLIDLADVMCESNNAEGQRRAWKEARSLAAALRVEIEAPAVDVIEATVEAASARRVYEFRRRRAVTGHVESLNSAKLELDR